MRPPPLVDRRHSRPLISGVQSRDRVAPVCFSTTDRRYRVKADNYPKVRDLVRRAKAPNPSGGRLRRPDVFGWSRRWLRVRALRNKGFGVSGTLRGEWQPASDRVNGIRPVAHEQHPPESLSRQSSQRSRALGRFTLDRRLRWTEAGAELSDSAILRVRPVDREQSI